MSSLDILTIRQYAFIVRLDIHQGISKNLLLRKNSYARHLLRQPPLECESTPSEGFLAAAAPICFFFNQTSF
ncbi:MAG: hypothetical protein J6A57_01000 [Ruminococcus sp.]|nr:hypothetical protein [Ruminococcus sp.]